MNLEMLQEITATAVKAAGYRDYDVSPLQQMCLRPDGTSIDIQLAPPPPENKLLDIAACVDVYNANYGIDGAEAYVSADSITIVHDGTRTKGKSVCLLTRSETIKLIEKHSYQDLKPETFEKIAKLYFGADALFINRLRKLQWKTSLDTTTRISTVSKSADVHEIAQVMDENQVLFQDITLLVTTPYFVLPIETMLEEIELHIIANAEAKTISFAPSPGVMEKICFSAMQAIRTALDVALGKDVVMLGSPVM
jgi:hypothetical protein